MNARRAVSDEEMRRMVCEMYDALIGDPLHPQSNPGLVKIVTDLHSDYHGENGNEDDGKSIGTRRKVEILWRDRVRLYAICGFIGLLGSVVGWLIPIILGKH